MPVDGFLTHFERLFADIVGERVLVALSGGADSVALLHLLATPSLRLRLEALHLHHGVRGEEADEDADLCRQLCETLGVRFHLVHLPTAASHREGREAGWRRLRYLQLQQLARHRGIPWIATGHQRDDVAEGVLMQLLRGGGPRALAGVLGRTAQGLIRPLLPYSHAELVQWLRSRQVPWREDSSNRDPGHLRNRVRHELLPVLEGASPRLREHLVVLAHTLAEDEAHLCAELDRRCPAIDPWRADGGVPVSHVVDLPTSLRSRWLHKQAAQVGIGRVTRRQLATFNALLDDGCPRSVTLCDRWTVRRAAGQLWLEPPRPVEEYEVGLSAGECEPLPLPTWAVRLRRLEEPSSHAEWTWRPPPGTITVRSPRADDTIEDGDRTLRLAGMLRRRLPRHLRRAWPVFCVGDTIAWVPGVWLCIARQRPGNLVVEVIRT